MNYLETGIKLLNLIDDYGYEAYIVGGAVRDYILGYEINDIDITTSMPIRELEMHFDVKDSGSKYLSLTIFYDGYTFEVTNFRREYLYHDHRHPEVEIISNINKDLKRRDFTINAMLIDKNFKIIDKYNGEYDIKNKIVRAIGDPYIKFDEDALRILRGLYLVSKYNFMFEETTLDAITEKKYLLSTLSNERLYEYFLKIAPYKSEYLLKFIEGYELFSEINDYYLWLKVAIGDNYINDSFRFYITYHKYPPYMTNYIHNLIYKYNVIRHNDFSLMTLYENQDIIDKLYPAFEYKGYDVKEIRNKVNNLKIKNGKELAISKRDIAANFSGRKKKLAINKIIEEILLGNINNQVDDINKVIAELKNEEN